MPAWTEVPVQTESGGPPLRAVYGTSHQRPPRDPGEEACPNDDRLNFQGERAQGKFTSIERNTRRVRFLTNPIVAPTKC